MRDQAIRECWSRNRYGHQAAKRAAALTGMTPEQAARRATQLGLIFSRERYRWTDAEWAAVEANAHYSLDYIQKKLRGVSPAGVKRTRSAIAAQIHAQRLRANLDGMDQERLAEALGISTHLVGRFRCRGSLRGSRLESLAAACGYRELRDGTHRPWFYHHDEIVRFLFACRSEIDLRRVNQVWLMGLLESYVTVKRRHGES